MFFRCIPALLGFAALPGVLIALAVPLGAQNGGVTVREDKLALSTYNEGPPDPNPPFDAFYRNLFPNYPYTIRTAINKVAKMTPWRVLILENEYLSCRVLPDLGGHLHGCTDRITGREIFYANPAVRRTAESVRNSFIAMGIESSFPFAHSRVASSPVDFAWSVRDGAGRVVVEDTDRTTGMEWRDEFILRAGVAALEQRVTLYNGSAARRGYHWWANAAVEVDDPHLRIVYPVKWMLPHGDGPMIPWPVNSEGLDLSDIANHEAQAGYFGHASREPWMAIYKPAFRGGVAHFADPERVKGKKIWLWGTTDRYVQQTLTQNFNSYVEMQAGEFETQPEFAFLLPEESKTFTHYWIPFRDLGGVSRVTRDAVLNLSRDRKNAVLELNVTHVIKGAKIRVSDGAKVISETQVDLDPRVRYAKTLENAPAKITLDVLNAPGTVILHHVEGEYNALPFDKTAKNPEPVGPTDHSGTEAAILERVSWFEQRDEWAAAWNEYPKSPSGGATRMLAAGRATFVLNRYSDAIRLLKDLVASSAEAAYYYGTALGSAPGNLSEAQRALARASSDPTWAPAAQLQLALLGAREHKGPRQAEATRMLQALAAAPGASARLGALEAAMLRRTGKPGEAGKRLDYWLEQDPANDLLRVERALSGATDDAALWSHLGADPERVLNVAEQYRQIGACDDALKVLDRRYSPVSPNETEPGAVLPQENPLVVYFRGYCRAQMGGDPAPDFRTAKTLSTLYVFPHREIDFRILAAALQRDSADEVAHALLGDLDFNALQTDQAIAEWKKALAIRRDLPSLHRNLGLALLDMKNDPAAAAPVLLEGKRFAPDDREIAEALRRLHLAKGVEPAATPSTGSGDSGTNPGSRDAVRIPAGEAVGGTAADALLQAPVDPEAAATLFNATVYPKDKQPDDVRRAYIEVQLQRLLARAHAGQCGDALAGLETLGDEDRNVPFTLYGFGSFIKRPHFQYYLGLLESTCGSASAAKKRWARLSRNSEPVDSPDYAFAALAAKRLGENDAAAKIDTALQTLKKASPEELNPGRALSEGALLMAAGRSAEGDALLQRSLHAADPFFALYEPCGAGGGFLEMRFCLRFAALLLTCSLAWSQNGWPAYGHDPGGLRYSPLTQITPQNVAQLQRAWTFHSGKPGSETTPLVIDGVMYLTAPNGIYALEPETGKVIWKFQAANVTRRGLAFWPGDKNTHPRVYSGTGSNLLAIDVTTGKPAPGFGTEGLVDMKKGVLGDLPDARLTMQSPPAVFKDIIITGSNNNEPAPSLGAYGDIRGWDARTGKLIWTFHTVPRKGEPGNETWEGDSWKNRSGVNNWGFMTVDVARGLVLVPLGCPTTDFYGADRHGDGLYGNSLVALDAATGQVRWFRQLVHHDLWDYDVAAAPALIDINRRGVRIAAVAQITKTGLLFLFDRVTGQPIYGMEERPVPQSKVPGEQTSPTQPFPLKPPPLSKSQFTPEDIYKSTPDHAAFCKALWEDQHMYTEGPFTPMALDGNALTYPSTLGGGNWSGVSFNPDLGYVFTNIMNLAQWGHMEKKTDAQTGVVTWNRTSANGSAYGRFWDPENHIPCQEPPFGELVAVNVNTGDIAWKVPLGTVEALEAKGVHHTGALNLGGSIATASGLVFIAATNDNRIRAFDAKSGKELWAGAIDADGQATPITYLGKDGRQYVAIMAGGGSFWGAPGGDGLAAFALPLK